MIYFLVNVGEDCPVFDGLYEFCQISTGGSVGKSLLNLLTYYPFYFLIDSVQILHTSAQIIDFKLLCKKF